METKNIYNVEDAITVAAFQAMQAYCQGTFSVGGLLMDTNGNILNVMHNNVVNNKLILDPTAHGERQLIDWYFQQKKSGILLPPPESIILVTSLDPCCMCTGSILEAGFKVVVAALDTMAGINYKNDAMFSSLSPILQDEAKTTFSYPKVVGTTCFVREASGAIPNPIFINTDIHEQTLALTTTVFESTLTTVRDLINVDLLANELVDLITLEENDPIITSLKIIYPNALTYKSTSNNTPDIGLAPYLIEAANLDKENGGNGDAVAFLDYFGNLLLCLPGDFNSSPINTAFLQTSRSYAKLRYDLMVSIGDRTLKYLGHPKYGTFILAKGYDKSARSLADLGAYGSTIEGPLPTYALNHMSLEQYLINNILSLNPNQLQYGVPRIPQNELTEYCQGLPPFYSSVVQVNPVQIEDQELITALEKGLPQDK